MSDQSKRFIKKVPPSGSAPIFKLTLPHQIVHSHLRHLIDNEFEIATSAHATNVWQGVITRRRNKQRSEYTLQGWRLFAEAHGVQSGDQVSFELVTPTRLVVRVMSTEEAKQMSPGLSNATSLQEDPQNLDTPPNEPAAENLDLLVPLPAPIEQMAERRIESLESLQDMNPFRQARSMESSFKGTEAKDLPPMNKIREFLSTGPAAARPPSITQKQAHLRTTEACPEADDFRASMESPRESVRNAPNDWAFSMPSPSPRSFANTPMSRSLEMPGLSTPDFLGLGPRRDSGSPYSSSSQLQNQMLEMRSTIQAQQASLHFYEAKARRAELEASQTRLFYSELHVNMSKQTRLVIHAGEALEHLVGRLSGPEFVRTADQATVERLILLQSELFKQLHNLKSCLLNLLSLEA